MVLALLLGFLALPSDAGELPEPRLPKEFRWHERGPKHPACPGATEDAYQQIVVQDAELKNDENVKLPGKLYVSETGPYKLSKDRTVEYSFMTEMEKLGYQQLRLRVPKLNVFVSGILADGPQGSIAGYVAAKDSKVRMATFAYEFLETCGDDEEPCADPKKAMDVTLCAEMFISDPVELKDLLLKRGSKLIH